ncbi:MAG: Dam family site-specific DNA-(adenine-N6)-methyltransferase [Burkholderiales bacterium]|nr:Dam family site-specific DNA-(adenine-N6)-methyltransferase [Anaerolineae bacterium]
MYSQLPLFQSEPPPSYPIAPFKTQLLKWVGNKQRFAHEIIGYFPATYNTYFEPFLGSGAILGTLAPENAVASDVLKPLVEIWQTLKTAPETLKLWYEQRWDVYQSQDRVAAYEQIKSSYNAQPNAADLLFVSRSCYGGVVRFRKDGYISTPCGIHAPIQPESFANRVDIWGTRTKGTEFIYGDFEDSMDSAQKGDLIYCDPPYTYTQAILYGAQKFSLERLFNAIARCKTRGVYVALSLDGTKKTGKQELFIPVPTGLFEQEIHVNVGRSMLKRFQMAGETLEAEVVSDRLLLTY